MALSICPASLLFSLYYVWTRRTSLFLTATATAARMKDSTLPLSLHVWMNTVWHTTSLSLSLPPISTTHIYYSICRDRDSLWSVCVMFHVNRSCSTVEIHLYKRPECVLYGEVCVYSMCRITPLLYISVLTWQGCMSNVRECVFALQRHKYVHYQHRWNLDVMKMWTDDCTVCVDLLCSLENSLVISPIPTEDK